MLRKRFLFLLSVLLLLGLVACGADTAHETLHQTQTEVSYPQHNNQIVSAVLPPQNNDSLAEGIITLQQAKEIALSHAGVTVNNATVTEADFDTDDGVPSYEVTFVAQGNKYEYTINATNGEIVNVEKNDIAIHLITDQIPSEQAIVIALTHAKVDAANAVGIKVELDNQHGHTVYEVEFRAGGLEYDYTIHSQTGAILSAEAEAD